MKRNYFFVVAIIMALAVVGIASGASSDQGRRLTGPFCVGKSFLKPVFVGNVKVIRAGAVRSISINESCQSTENRKFGVAVLDPDANAPSAPGAKGDKGDRGATGATGAAGKDGQNGENGAQGATGETGPAGPAGADGKDGTVTGTIPVCASNGGNLKLCGGDNGHDPVGYLVLTGNND